MPYVTDVKIAIHEAGHARVALFYGFEAEAGIESDLSTGRAGVATTTRPEASVRFTALTEAVHFTLTPRGMVYEPHA